MGFLATTRGKIIAGIVAVVIVALVVWLIIWLSINSLWPIARDIAVISLALITFVPIIALSYAIFQIARTAKVLREELAPIANDLRESTQSVRDTIKVAGEFAVKPSLRTASILVGVRQGLAVILGQGQANKRKEDRIRRQAKEQEAQAKQAARETKDAVH